MFNRNNGIAGNGLLIEPQGIEMLYSSSPFLSIELLIEPQGIEIKHCLNVLFVFVLLIEPQGIEIVLSQIGCKT